MAGGIIYLVTCTATGKHYVGQTVRTLETRWAQHLRDAGPGRFEIPLHRALRKYGAENFDIRILETVCDRSDLNRREAEYTTQYEALVPQGYVLRAAGGRPSAFSELSRARMSVASRIKWTDPAYR